MKIYKINLIFLLLLVITACDPMKETYDEMDKNPTPIIADIQYTLTDDDYETAGQTYPNFSSVDDAKTGIPLVLADLYPQLGEGSSAMVNYDFYQGSVKYSYDDYNAGYDPPTVSNPIPTYTVQSADYDAILGTPNYGNFDNDDDVNAFLDYKYPSAGNNDGVSLTYDWYAGGTSTVTATWSKHYDQWFKQRVLSKDDGDYEYMGRGTRDYFSSTDDAEAKIPVWLKPQFPYAKAGDRYLVQYLFRDYNDEDNNGWAKEKERLVLNEFDGANWFMVGSVIAQSLKLGHDGSTWVPDNTIKYTMTGDDYAFVVANYESINSAGTASMSQYGNYDITLWSSDEISSSIADVLLNNFSGAEDGQKYLVSYKVWTGSAGATYTILMIKSGGAYVPAE